MCYADVNDARQLIFHSVLCYAHLHLFFFSFFGSFRCCLCLSCARCLVRSMHFLKLRARFWLPCLRSALRARDRTPQMHFVSFDCNWIFYAPNTSKVHVYSHFSLSAVSYHFHTIGSKVSAWWAPKIEKNKNKKKRILLKDVDKLRIKLKQMFR